MTTLTDAQLRLLAEVQRNGVVRRDGRAGRSALALQRAGLVTVECVPAAWNPESQAWAFGGPEVWTITAVGE